jgi:hypothetical protein
MSFLSRFQFLIIIQKFASEVNVAPKYGGLLITFRGLAQVRTNEKLSCQATTKTTIKVQNFASPPNPHLLPSQLLYSGFPFQKSQHPKTDSSSEFHKSDHLCRGVLRLQQKEIQCFIFSLRFQKNLSQLRKAPS